MKPITINQRIIDAAGLSSGEKKVLDTLLHQTLAGNVSQIADRAMLPRTTTRRILKALEKRGLAFKLLNVSKKRYLWRYKSGLEKLKSV